MKKIFNVFTLLASALAMLASCNAGYNITGTSIQSVYDGDMVMLRPMSVDDDKAIDSCKILHGKFKMSGCLDSVMCVRMFIGNMGDNIPVILEQGDIQVSSTSTGMKVEGTPLNDKFYAFMKQRDSLQYLINEIPRKETTMIMDGVSEDEILIALGDELATLGQQIDKLETDFVTDNYDNVLGITYFLVLCDCAYAQFGFPTTTPQIDEIYGRAPESFRNNKDITEYMNKCNGK